ncbi:hypothetical protein [Bradyrhizobium sp.]|uniref:hypothetical protein n=1 Tax=Bradyrhizobium sp. TaxID=376 RepID=UPI002BA66937|nr:hypothetical protein [Bradyrhizobium sp.]HMM89151.1 hypothetical protein [Bradyrhizobium sp.]
MPWQPEGAPSRPRLLMASVAMLLAIGFALTLAIFYPGVMTFDSRYLHEYAMKGTMGDWQSPVMVWLWALIDPIISGAGSMFLLIATTYWLGFGLLSLTLASRGGNVALLLPLLAMTPPSLALAGVIWRDVLFAACWLLAASVTFAVDERQSWIRLAGQALGLALVVFGVLLRPNALLAAPILAAYTIWLSRTSLRRATILYIPAVLVFFGAVQFVYYGMLGAKREHPLQTVMIFDLGGISHFAKANQFPVEWSEAENAMLLEKCYQPTMWDIYWRLEPCDFVMRKVEREKGLFGTSAISKAWLAAILHHPVAWLQHRSAFMWNFLAGDNLAMWTADIENPGKDVFADRAAFGSLRAALDALKPTPLLRAGFWLLACIVLCGIGRNRAPREAAFVFAACGSAAVYVLTFYGVGVASDFRYGYWAVLAAMAGGVVLLAGEGGRSKKG